MTDGLFHQRASHPVVDLDAIVRAVVEFEDRETHGKNVTIPCTWEIVDRAEPWPRLTFRGVRARDGVMEPWAFTRQIPRQRADETRIRVGVEQACLLLAVWADEQRRQGVTFHQPSGVA